MFSQIYFQSLVLCLIVLAVVHVRSQENDLNDQEFLSRREVGKATRRDKICLDWKRRGVKCPSGKRAFRNKVSIRKYSKFRKHIK